MYKQVSLWKFNKRSHPTRKICWIPQQFAIRGKEILIDGEDGVWFVDNVWDCTIDSPIYPEALIREHRKNTGDALPRRKA